MKYILDLHIADKHECKATNISFEQNRKMSYEEERIKVDKAQYLILVKG